MKNHSVALFWFIAGSVCWFISYNTFIFSNTRLAIPVTNYTMRLWPSGISYILTRYVPYFPGFIITFLFTLFLSGAMRSKKMWYFAFIAWPVGYSVYVISRSNANPSMILMDLLASTMGSYIIASCIMTPAVALLGTVMGNKWNTKRKNA